MGKRTKIERRVAERLRELLGNNYAVFEENSYSLKHHPLHPFPAPMSLLLALNIIARSTNSDGIILDPMAGSGTVLTAARALGRVSYGFDVDPLARLIMRVSTSKHNVIKIKEIGDEILHYAISLCRKPYDLDNIFVKRFDKETQDFICFWFPKGVRRKLIALWYAIERIKSRKVRDVLALVFSRTIIAKTAGVSRAIDLAHTRPHKKIDKKVPDPLLMFPRRLNELAQRLRYNTQSINGEHSYVRKADARRLPLGDSSIDLVLTSSPYANAIDYIRSHKFSLVWMGYSISELRKLRGNMVGADRSEHNVTKELSWVDQFLPQGNHVEERRRAVFRRYFYDLNAILKEIERVLRTGGACVLVLGLSKVRGYIVNTPLVAIRLAATHGLEHLGTQCREINPQRRSLPFPTCRNRLNPLCKRMAHEYIVGLGKV